MPDEQASDSRPRRGPPTISGEAARQGRIILDTRTRRWIFIGGLVGFVLLAVVAGVIA